MFRVILIALFFRFYLVRAIVKLSVPILCLPFGIKISKSKTMLYYFLR
jgi:hypothetical protein